MVGLDLTPDTISQEHILVFPVHQTANYKTLLCNVRLWRRLMGSPYSKSIVITYDQDSSSYRVKTSALRECSQLAAMYAQKFVIEDNVKANADFRHDQQQKTLDRYFEFYKFCILRRNSTIKIK